MEKFKYIFLVLVLILAFLFIRENLDEVKRIQNISPQVVIYLVILNLLSRLLIGYRIKIVAQVFNVRLKFKEWFGIAAINSFYNYLFTKSGLLAHAWYFKKKFEIPMQNYLVTFGAVQVFTLLACGLFGLPLAFYANSQGTPGTVFIIFFLVLILGTGIFIFFPGLKFNKEGSIWMKINQLTAGWSILRRSHSLCAVLLICELVNLCIFSIRYYIAVTSLGFEIDGWVAFLLAPITILSNFIGITPAALGIREAAGGLLTHILGLGLQLGVLAVALDRVVVMLIAFTLGPVFSYTLLKDMNREEILKPV